MVVKILDSEKGEPYIEQLRHLRASEVTEYSLEVVN
jgi:hypothetical protein